MTDANIGTKGSFWISQGSRSVLGHLRLEGNPLDCGGLQHMLRGNWPNGWSFSVSFGVLQLHDSNLLLGLKPEDVHKVAGKPVQIEQPGVKDSHLAVYLTFSRAVFTWYACSAKVGRKFEPGLPCTTVFRWHVNLQYSLYLLTHTQDGQTGAGHVRIRMPLAIAGLPEGGGYQAYRGHNAGGPGRQDSWPPGRQGSGPPRQAEGGGESGTVIGSITSQHL